jgi:nitrite reductase/ring-hydroxylating ferredoxin subunit
MTRNVSRTVLQRLVGLPATPEPENGQCWFRAKTMVLIDLLRTPELWGPEGAVRLEGGDPPVRLLVFRGDDGQFHAILNRCGHRGRRLDPVPGGRTIQCCSLGRSTFDYRGRILHGPACKALKVCRTYASGSRIVVKMTDPFESLLPTGGSRRPWKPGGVRSTA